MDNKMAEVAKLLGVELDEVFFFKGCSGCYTYCSKTYLKFTENGLKESVNRTSWHNAAAWMWKSLITGTLQIIKLPWNPKEGEECYISTVDNEFGCYTTFWENTDNYKRCYDSGLVFKTREEAVELARRMLAVAKEGKNNG